MEKNNLMNNLFVYYPAYIRTFKSICIHLDTDTLWLFCYISWVIVPEYVHECILSISTCSSTWIWKIYILCWYNVHWRGRWWHKNDILLFLVLWCSPLTSSFVVKKESAYFTVVDVNTFLKNGKHNNLNYLSYTEN